VTGRTSAAGVAGHGWRGDCGPIYRLAVSGGYAGRAGQNGERHWAGGPGDADFPVICFRAEETATERRLGIGSAMIECAWTPGAGVPDARGIVRTRCNDS
jgi:hypothetical protein